MVTINPKEVPTAAFHAYLLGAVTPRPIAFASTTDLEGRVNLSPFSFFNCFGANPPLLIVSPARRGKDNTTKHTYENVRVLAEVVIKVVNHAMVQQASLASNEFPKEISEFRKAGFTEEVSVMVRPPFTPWPGNTSRTARLWKHGACCWAAKALPAARRHRRKNGEVRF